MPDTTPRSTDAPPLPTDAAPLPIIDHAPAPYTGPPAAELREKRAAYLNPAIFHYYKDPLPIVQGHMQYLYDAEGRRYLDALGGVVTVSVGHCHPKLTQRLQEQIATLVHTTTVYLHPNIVALAESLAQHMPTDSGLSQSYFTNSGSDSNELAVLMARLHTGRHDVIALRGGYHGCSETTLSMTGVGSWKYPVAAASGVRHVPNAYCYRCPFGLEYPSCDLRCAKNVAETIEWETGKNVAAFIAEPIQGVGGIIVPPAEFLPEVYALVRKHGGLCISDEVQTAWGRTGKAYWGFEAFGVTPDLVTMAKGFGNGTPLGAVTTRPEIARDLAQRLHFNTFGGNPVSALAGLTTLEIVDEDGLQARCMEIGGYLKEQLLALQDKHALIGDVRGMGLLLGVELVADRQTKQPATEQAGAVSNRARELGLLMGSGGLHRNVLRITPPMCISRDDCDFLIATLDAALGEVEGMC